MYHFIRELVYILVIFITASAIGNYLFEHLL